MAWGVSSVNSWYKNRAGRVTQNWPFSLLEFWEQTAPARPRRLRAAVTLTAVAHTAICVPDVHAAVQWYTDTLGFELQSPPYLMEGEAIERDMGELVPSPRLEAAIIGLPGGGDRVLEIIEYPGRPGRPRAQDASLVDHGLTHVGLVCDDIAETRSVLESRGVRFLTSAIASVAGLRTTWFADPWGTVFILMEKRDPSRPYFAQY